MAEFRRDRKLSLSAAFFSFGIICGILTGRYSSASVAAMTAEKIRECFSLPAAATGALLAMTVPILLLLLSMTLFGALLILPCVLLSGGLVGWSVCCLLRCGAVDTLPIPMLLCALIVQAPCLVLIAAACIRLSASLRTTVSGAGLRRPDIAADLRLLAVCFLVKLLSAVLLSMLLQRITMI